MMRRRVLAVCSAIVLAVAVGVIAAGANPGAYLLTLAVVAGVLAVPLAVLGWVLFGSAPTGAGEAIARATGAGSAKVAARGTGARAGGGALAGNPDWSDRATAAAWRDTVIATSVVLVVVAFVGVQWRTSYVLLGVVVLALLAQGVRQVQVSRQQS